LVSFSFHFFGTIQIPQTDIDCRWDWRSLRCESSCICHFQWQWGDYHFGRACRYLPQEQQRQHSIEEEEEIITCVPSIYIVDQPIPKRLISLLLQTADILYNKIQRTLEKIHRIVQDRYRIAQQQICFEVWNNHLYTTLDGTQCWIVLPDSVTIYERVMCGAKSIPLCQRHKTVDQQHS
jgi:hypothetical protein